MVKSCVVRRASYVALLLLVPALLRAQDVIGIRIGETPPAVTLENLNGDSVVPGLYLVRARATTGETVVLKLGVRW
jgi:hypothetical protein